MRAYADIGRAKRSRRLCQRVTIVDGVAVRMRAAPRALNLGPRCWRVTQAASAASLRSDLRQACSHAPGAAAADASFLADDPAIAAGDDDSAADVLVSAAAVPANVGSGQHCFVLGIDPDVNGALAALRWRSSSRDGDGDGGGGESLETHVYDAPVQLVSLTSRPGRQPLKRHAPGAMSALLASLNAPPGTLAMLERPTARFGNSLQSAFQSGAGLGLWWGVLTAHGFTVRLTSPQAWKRGYDLLGQELDKDDSRAVACALFPEAAALMGRKRDHGRAEAVLIAAYGATLAAADAEKAAAGRSDSSDVPPPPTALLSLAAAIHSRRAVLGDSRSQRGDVLQAAADASAQAKVVARAAAKAAAPPKVKLTAAEQRQRKAERAMAAAAEQTIAELKEKLKSLGLKVSGSKQELLERLRPSLTPAEPAPKQSRKSKAKKSSSEDAKNDKTS